MTPPAPSSWAGHIVENLVWRRMTPLGYDRYCDEVIIQTDLLRDVLKGADLSVIVPTCPDWTLTQLVRPRPRDRRADLDGRRRPGQADP
jgi:hypothetical protein